MHELSIAMSIAEIAEKELHRRGDAHALAVHLKLGPLSGVVPEALRSAWELAREGTTLEETQLVIEEIPILAHCPTCRADRSVVSIQEIRCQACGTPTPHIVSGQELEITALEIDA